MLYPYELVKDMLDVHDDAILSLRHPSIYAEYADPLRKRL